jgi:hypothetical protein
MFDEIDYPTGFSLKDIVSWGNSGMIRLDKPSQTIAKSPHGEENKNDIPIDTITTASCPYANKPFSILLLDNIDDPTRNALTPPPTHTMWGSATTTQQSL